MKMPDDLQLTDDAAPSAENGPAESSLNETHEALLDNLRVFAAERDEAKESALRAMAELQNFRRRSQMEKEQLRQMATEGLVVQLLPVLDNFERTIRSLDSGASVESIIEGVRGVERQLRSALESVKVAKIESVGAAFDPEFHEALGTDETDEFPENTVTMELESGYQMAGNVIRPARVRVSKKP